MDFLDRDALRPLIDEHAEYCLSLYLPTHRTGAAIRQDPIRLKNLLKRGEAQLTQHGWRRAAAEELLAPAARLLKDDDFWQHQSDGLAILISPNTFRRYRLPYAFDELVVVTDRFHLKPLLSLLSGDGRFYILALSQKRVRLLLGTRHSVQEMSLEAVPTSLAEALGEERDKELQFHVAGHGGAVFHGHGSRADETEHKKDLFRYFKRLDKGLRDLICVDRAPLVLAGVDYLLPIYREANSCAELVDDGIVGSPENITDSELHARAWRIVQTYFSREQELAAARYRELARSDRTSDDLAAIVPAAHHGRVADLFVAVGVQRWGRYQPGSGRVTLHETRQPGDQDLLDVAAVQTLAHAGAVYAVEPGAIPARGAGQPTAAVLRY